MEEIEEIEQYLGQSEKIINEIEKVKDLYGKFKGDSEMEFVPLQTKDTEISEEIERFEKLSKKIIGQLYEGVLISKELTIRQGRIFYFRKRYGPGLVNVLEIIKHDEEELKEKLDNAKLMLLKFINEKFECLNEMEKINKVEEIKFEKPIKIFLMEKDYREKINGVMEEICSLEVNKNEFYLRDNRGNSISYNEYYKIIFSKFGKEINQLKENLLNRLNETYDNIIKINKELEVKGAKYLIASTL